MNNYPIKIFGTGHAVPKQRVTSIELDHQLGYPQGQVERVGGVKARYFASKTENASMLGAQAAEQALAAAHLHWQDIDALVCASATMEQSMPCNAALLHAQLRLSTFSIPAFDINASCLGFLAALDNIAWALVAGRYRRVMIVAADLASCGLNWQQLEASAIFGDGAAAAVIGIGDQSALLASDLITFSEGVDFCRIQGGGTRFHPTRLPQSTLPLAMTLFEMNGKSVFRLAAEHLPSFVERLLQKAEVSLSEIDWIIPHQASHLAMKHLSKSLHFPPEKVIDIFANYGNQVAASLPTALDIAIRDGRIQRQDKILLLGTGAGLSIGGAVMVY